MAKRIKAAPELKSAFIAADLRDSKTLEEHAKLFLVETTRIEIPVKNQIQSELNVGLAKRPGKPDMLIVTVKLTVESHDDKDASAKIASYFGIFRQIYEVKNIYGEIDENAIHVEAIQPYVFLAMTIAASGARDAFAKLGIPGLVVPIQTDFNLAKQKA